MSAGPTLRRRLVRGGQGQVASHAARAFAQVASVSILLASWGLHRYGDWVILAALPTYLAFSDIGFTGAATNEMTMAIGRDDHLRAREVFQAVSGLLLVILLGLAAVLPLLAVAVPVAELFNLSTLNDSAAGWTLVALGLDALFTVYAGLLYGALASGGHYGEGAMLMSLTMLWEFGALALAALLGAGPVLAAVAMCAGQAAGTGVMYIVMRRRVPWLWAGRPGLRRAVLRPLLPTAVAAGAIPGALAVSLQGTVLLVGLSLGPASAAIYSTLRTMSRAVIQVVASVAAIVTPEISRAYAAGNAALLRTIHRRSCQAAFWLTLVLVIGLSVAGGSVLHVWTSGRIRPDGWLLGLFLAATVVDALWYTSLTVLYATNRHQHAAAAYTVVSLLSLPVAYALLKAWGLHGVALTLLAADVIMLVPVLRQSLPAAHDRLGDWLSDVLVPPVWLGAIARGRAPSGPA